MLHDVDVVEVTKLKRKSFFKLRQAEISNSGDKHAVLIVHFAVCGGLTLFN